MSERREKPFRVLFIRRSVCVCYTAVSALLRLVFCGPRRTHVAPCISRARRNRRGKRARNISDGLNIRRAPRLQLHMKRLTAGVMARQIDLTRTDQNTPSANGPDKEPLEQQQQRLKKFRLVSCPCLNTAQDPASV